jgi:heme a synthase
MDRQYSSFFTTHKQSKNWLKLLSAFCRADYCGNRLWFVVMAYKLSLTSLREEATALRTIHRLILALCVLTFGLMALGSLTRVMGAGLSCPDWPLCYGQIVPHMDQYIFLEWFHRQIATLVGLGTLLLLGLSWYARPSLPRWMPWFSALAFALVLFQGVLGALTVTQYLRFDIVTAHLGTAMLYFGTLLAAAAALQPLSPGTAKVGWIPQVAIGATVVCYGQIILGGLVASQWALNQCLTGSVLCNVMNNHLFGVVPATLAVLFAAFVSWRQKGFRWAAFGLLGLLALQIGLGVTTFYLKLSVQGLTVAHLAVGAALFGALIWLSVLSLRQRALGLSH